MLMIVDFHSADRMLGLKACGIYQKGIEAAKAACEKIYAPTLELGIAEGEANVAGDWIAEHLDEMGIGEVRELDVPTSSALALRTACSVYLGQLGKLSEKQIDLLVPVEDTNTLMSQLQSLCDRLKGQVEMNAVMDRVMDMAEEATVKGDDGKTTVTLSSGGRSVTMTDKQFERMAKKKK